MTLREEIVKNSGVLLEMPIKRTELIRETLETPLGTFIFRNPTSDLEIDTASNKEIYEYIEDATILEWDANLIRDFVDYTGNYRIGLGRNKHDEHARVISSKRAEPFMDLLAEKLPVGMFKNGVKKCEERLKYWEEHMSSSFLANKTTDNLKAILERFKNKHNNGTRWY